MKFRSAYSWNMHFINGWFVPELLSSVLVSSLTLRLLMSYIYMEHLFLMFLDHTQWRTTVGRTQQVSGLRPLTCWDRGFESHRGHGFCCECRVLSGRGLCDELITRPEESYRLWCVVCDLETSRIGAPYVYNISCLRVNHHSILFDTE